MLRVGQTHHKIIKLGMLSYIRHNKGEPNERGNHEKMILKDCLILSFFFPLCRNRFLHLLVTCSFWWLTGVDLVKKKILV